MTTTVLNRKINKVENKIPSVGNLVKKTDYDAKIKDIEEKYLTAADCNKFTIKLLEYQKKDMIFC